MINEITTNLYLLTFLSAVLAFVLAIRMYPVIIYTVRTKNLMDEPEDRSSHTLKTPTLGGVGLFVAFFIAAVLFGVLGDLEKPELVKLLCLGVSTMILLFLGIKDDLIALAPKKKFLGQLGVSALVIFVTDIRITSLEGLLGVGTLPYVVSVVFTLFVFILVINAFNLIDGIDGLAGTIALISCFSFGIFSLINQHYYLALISFSAIGAIVGFLLFNLSKSRKLFMGDSGSMFLGFLLAYQGIYFLQLNHADGIDSLQNAPIFLLAVLSFPLLDTLRVFIIRAREGRSPFSPDRNHMHHILIDKGMEHKQATIVLALVNILVIQLAIVLRKLEINLHLLTMLFLVSIIYVIIFKVSGVKSKRLDVLNDKNIPDNLLVRIGDSNPKNRFAIKSTGKSYSAPIEEKNIRKLSTISEYNASENEVNYKKTTSHRNSKRLKVIRNYIGDKNKLVK